MTSYTRGGIDTLVKELFILFINLSMSESLDIYMTKNRFLGHVSAFLLTCKCLCVLVTEITQQGKRHGTLGLILKWCISIMPDSCQMSVYKKTSYNGIIFS